MMSLSRKPFPPTIWQYHVCFAGPHLYANTARCTYIGSNQLPCGHDFCFTHCRKDDEVPEPLLLLETYTRDFNSTFELSIGEDINQPNLWRSLSPLSRPLLSRPPLSRPPLSRPPLSRADSPAPFSNDVDSDTEDVAPFTPVSNDVDSDTEGVAPFARVSNDVDPDTEGVAPFARVPNDVDPDIQGVAPFARVPNDVDPDTEGVAPFARVSNDVDPDTEGVAPFARVSNDVDPDTESVASSTFSKASTDTIESGITDYSQDKMISAYADLFALIAFDSDLRPLFVAASASERLSAEDFTTTLRRSLKKLAQDLRSETLSKAHKEARTFISKRAERLARDTVNKYWWSNKPEEQSPVVSDHDGSSSGEDGEGIEISEQPASFDSMKAFIRSSTAFAKFITRIQRYVQESLILWESVGKEWEEELHTFTPHYLPGNPTIRILDRDDVSLVDLVKLALERYSGEEWIWRPFARPRRKLANGKIRVMWKCVSTSSLFQIW
jgi:hypothetical protein